MPYSKTNVFPLNEVDDLAMRVGGGFAEVIAAIPKYAAEYPIELVTPPVVYQKGPSQVRRALYYKALIHFGLWDQFVTKYWPGANTARGRTQIRWIEDSLLKNGLLAKHNSWFAHF